MATLPAPTYTFPAPAPYPLSPTAQEPGFGVNPYSVENMYVPSPNPYQGNTDLLLQRRATQQQQMMQSAQFATTNGALGGVLDSDPRGWTPEQAMEQTDRALAKLSTVNPDLANQLAAQRTGQPVEDGGGFFDDIKDLVGGLLKPGFEVAGRVLDIVARTSRIIPNLAYDLVDGGEFDPLADVSGALTGEIVHNWNGVMQEMGWEGGGLGGFLRASIGLVGDVLTDPITWLIPAGAAAKIAQSSAVGGKKAAVELTARTAKSMSDEALTKVGLGDAIEYIRATPEKELMTFLQQQWDSVANFMGNEGRRLGVQGSEDAAERAAAAVGGTWTDGTLALTKKMWEVGDTTARLIQNRGFRQATRDGMWVSDGFVSAKDVKGLFESFVKTGNGKQIYQEALAAGRTPKEAAAVAKAAWKMGRNYASIVGGARLKVAVPYTQFRYISTPLFTQAKLTPHAVGSQIARFFAGNSASQGIIHEIAENGAPVAMLRDYMEGGWEKLSKIPEYANHIATIRGRGKNLGSYMYSASEKVGGITARLSTESRAARMGLPAYFAHEVAQRADNAKRDLIRGLMQRTGYKDSHVNPDIEAHFSISQTTKKHLATDDQLWEVAQVLDYFPPDVMQDLLDNPDLIDEWYRAMHPELDQLEGALALPNPGPRGEDVSGLGEDASEKVARHLGIIEDMQRVAKGQTYEGGWTAKQKELLNTMGVRWQSARAEAGKWEAQIGDTTMRLDELMGIHPSQVADWKAGQGSNHAITEGTYWMSPHDAAAAQELRNHGIGKNHVVADNMPDGPGIKLHKTKQHPDDVEVVIRGPEYRKIDERGNAPIPGGLLGGKVDRTLDDIRQEAHDTVAARHADLEGNLGDEFADADSIARQEAEIVREALKRADSRDARGSYREMPDGDIEVTVWDPSDVKPVAEKYTVAGADMGYYPRTLSDEGMVWANGEVPRDEGQVILAVPQIRAEIERKTRGMTLNEANEKARDILMGYADEWRLPQASKDAIPLRVIEPNILSADAKYVDALAHDIGGRILGEGARRLNRLDQIAPFMFGAGTRAQQYEWDLSRGYVTLLNANKRELANAVLRLKKAEAKYLDHQHKQMAHAVEQADEFGLMVDEAMEAGSVLNLPDDVQAAMRAGEKLVEARARLVEARRLLDEGAARNSVDEAAYNDALRQYLDKMTEAKAILKQEAKETPEPKAPKPEARPKDVYPGSPETPFTEDDLRRFVKEREEARAAGDTWAEAQAQEKLEAAMGSGIERGHGVVVWKGQALEPGGEVYIKPTGAKRAQRVEIVGESNMAEHGGRSASQTDDALGVSYIIRRKGQPDTKGFLRYSDIEDMRPPKGETFKPYGYEARKAAGEAPSLSGEAVSERVSVASSEPVSFDKSMGYGFSHGDERMVPLDTPAGAKKQWQAPDGQIYEEVASTRTVQYVNPIEPATGSVAAYNDLASKRMVGIEHVDTPEEAYRAAQEMVEDAKRSHPTGKLTPAEKKAAKATRVKQWQDIMDAAEAELDAETLAVFKAEKVRETAQEKVNKIQDRMDRIAEKDNPTDNDELWLDDAEDLLAEAEDVLANAEDSLTEAQAAKAVPEQVAQATPETPAFRPPYPNDYDPAWLDMTPEQLDEVIAASEAAGGKGANERFANLRRLQEWRSQPWAQSATTLGTNNTYRLGEQFPEGARLTVRNMSDGPQQLAVVDAQGGTILFWRGGREDLIKYAEQHGLTLDGNDLRAQADELVMKYGETTSAELILKEMADALEPRAPAPAEAAGVNTALNWTVRPETDAAAAAEFGPFQVVDRSGNVMGNFDSERVAQGFITAAEIKVSEVATPAVVAAQQEARDALAEAGKHITPETGIPAQQLPTGEVLPGVNTTGTVLDYRDISKGDTPNEVVHHAQTDDVYQNGHKGDRPEDSGWHYLEGEVDPETGRTPGFQAYYDQIVTEGYPKPIEMHYFGPDNLDDGRPWMVADGNHSLELGHQAQHPYVPIVAKDYRTFPHDGTLQEQLAWEESMDWTDPNNYVDITELHPEEFRSPRKVAEQRFAYEVDAGNVLVNRKTGSMFNKEGNLVAKGGGVRVRSLDDIRLSQAQIESDLVELDKATRALDEGLEYEAPASAQEGARPPGAHRTPMERATFEIQQQQKRAALAGKKAAKRSREAGELARVGEKLRSNLEAVATTTNKLYAEAKGIRAQAKVAFKQVKTAGDMEGMTLLRIPGLEGYAMPKYIAEEWHSVLDHQGPGALQAGWRKWVLGPWKRWATYRWPGFHVRNMYGAWFNNFLGGVSVSEYGFSWRVNNFGNKDWSDVPVRNEEFLLYNLGSQFGDESMGKLTYGQVQAHLNGIGIGSTNSRMAVEVANDASAYRTAMNDLNRGNRGRARQAAHVIDSKMRNVGQHTENFHRVAAWGTGMSSTGGDTFGARAFVMMRHGDYADLTPAEDHIRDLVPFYKWMRTNIPYQIRMLAENPGKVTFVASKVKSYAYDVQGIDEQEARLSMPKWMQDTMAIPLGKGGPDGIKYLMADLPYNDLYNGLGDYISSFLPIGRNLIESYGFNTQAFTGKPLTGRMNKLSGAFGATWIGELLSKVPMTGVKKGADGSFYINDRMENVLTAFPIYSKFRNFLEADETRVEARLGGVLSSLIGVGLRDADFTQAELDFYYNELEPVLAAYRDMGVVFPSAQDFTRAAQYVAPSGVQGWDDSAAYATS